MLVEGWRGRSAPCRPPLKPEALDRNAILHGSKMSFRFSNLHNIGDRISVPIPKDKDGFLGRECPIKDCLGYFKVKPGTGLTGPALPCHCPYCGHQGPSDRFWTKDQIAYAKSVALRQVTEAIRKDLKSLEFDIKPRGSFGIGISMKLQSGTQRPIRHYREKKLETHVECSKCTLQYAVYGVFAYCPDCGEHNSLQMLEANLDLVRRQLQLAEQQEDQAFQRHLIEDALENCVSAFDGFGRETCRVRAHLSAEPATCESISFQGLARADMRLGKLFSVSLSAGLTPTEWSDVRVAFLQRHVLSHKAGVIDQQYVDESGDRTRPVGHRLVVRTTDVVPLVDRLLLLGKHLVSVLPPPR